MLIYSLLSTLSTLVPDVSTHTIEVMRNNVAKRPATIERIKACAVAKMRRKIANKSRARNR